jgi:hypothetical protein
MYNNKNMIDNYIKIANEKSPYGMKNDNNFSCFFQLSRF